MHRLPLLLTGAVLVTGLLSERAVPQDKFPQQSAHLSDEEKQVQAILATKYPYEAASSYSALFKSATVYGVLFKSATVARLRRLQTNPSDTIAIQAAWEEVELTVPFVEPAHAVRPDHEKLSWFLQFLEKRARVKAPRWWAEAILDARAYRRGNVYAGGINMGWPRMVERRDPKPKAAAPPRGTFDKQEDKSVVRVGSLSVPIPEDLQDKLKDSGPIDGVSILITPSRCYIAAYDGFGCPYRLACVERSSAKVRWVADVWASWWGGCEGWSQQWVEVTEQGDRVVVFGVAGAFHVEAFRMDDGVNVLRFSNSYSGE